LGQKRPASQAEHAVLPGQLLYVPAGQSTGAHSFGPGHTRPSGQTVWFRAPSGQKYRAAHGDMACAPSGHLYPHGHRVWLQDLCGHTNPASHGVGAVAPAGQYTPPMQSCGAEDPAGQ
jgi:hypothetical protein